MHLIYRLNSYDDLYRLKAGLFRYKTNLSDWTLANGNYNSEKEINYDLNGNILSLQRTNENGMVGDNLSYEYQGNQIVAVMDANQNNVGYFKNGTEKKSTTGLPEYTYDQNGNLVVDKNKGITVEYNMNNLPISVTYDDLRKIEWLYSSSGQKLRKNVYTYSNQEYVLVTKTDYVGGMEFENEQLKFIANDEGRVRPLAGTFANFKYEYDIKDHLGNVRMTITPDNNNVAQIIQEDSYYPFGLKIAGMTTITGPENKYTFNGKELVNDYDLNWYHYGARYYDPTLGRWQSIDPADEFHSPYVYGPNNPINGIDPDGTEWVDLGGGEIMWFDYPGVKVTPEGSTVNTWDDWNVISDNFASFNGNLFNVYDPNSQFPSFSVPADAGPLVNRQTSPSTQYQKGGATPEGRYMIDKINNQYWGELNIYNKYKSWIGGGKWPGGNRSWGSGRTHLMPLDHQTKDQFSRYVLSSNSVGRVIRSNMFIHGSTYRDGSRGCIDLGNNEMNFFKYWRNLNQPQMKVYVDY